MRAGGALGLRPPIAPMLATLAREVPAGDFAYEPKWDGFRCLCFRDGDEVDLRSRHGRPFSRYFPELAEAPAALPERGFVVDGEIVVLTERGFDFAALMGRLHPAASRVARLRDEAPAALVCFDLLADETGDLTARPFAERRRRLEELLATAGPPLFLTPLTLDAELARDWLARFAGAGVDGVMAKPLGAPYRPGARAMIKVKRQRTVDCVVAGVRTVLGEEAVASLLLGLYDEAGTLRHVGVAASFARPLRSELYADVRRHAIALGDHPWRDGYLIEGGAMGRLKGSAGRWTPEMELDWLPLDPQLVCEVAYDQLDDHRFRHPARFRRWRPDREARSCTLEQLVEPAPMLRELLPMG